LLFGVIQKARLQILGINRNIVLLLLGFNIWLLISAIKSNSGFIQNFYGNSGRYIGVITFFCLTILTFATAILVTVNFSKHLISSLVFCGIIVAIYGLIQSFNLDIISWKSQYFPVFSTLGNPNFLSAFLGLTAIATIYFIFPNGNSGFIKVIALFLIVLQLVTILRANSQQGLLVFLLGVSTYLNIWIFKNKSRKLYKIITSIQILVIILILSDILQIIPWGNLLYENSVSLRGDFWRTAWEMSIQNPLFGVGIAGFGDNFRLFRDLKTALRPESNFISDSPHNFLLELSITGGFLLVVIYIFVLLLVFNTSIKYFKLCGQFEKNYTILFSVWIGFLAQSLISVTNIGLSVWGWIMMGVLIGYPKIANYQPNKVLTLRPVILRSSIGFFIGLIISLPLLIADARLQLSLNNGNPRQIYRAVQVWPQSNIKLYVVADMFRRAGYVSEAKFLVQRSIEVNPINYNAWKVLYSLPNLSKNELNYIEQKLNKLDPLILGR
jgi:O-antigen ligase